MHLETPILFLATCDPARARIFYENVLELEFVADEAYALVFKVSGLDLRIQKVERMPNVAHTVFGWSVSDIRKTIKHLRGRVVNFANYDGLGQDRDGIWLSPGGGQLAWFKDPDGNTLSLTQYAKS